MSTNYGINARSQCYNRNLSNSTPGYNSTTIIATNTLWESIIPDADTSIVSLISPLSLLDTNLIMNFDSVTLTAPSTNNIVFTKNTTGSIQNKPRFK